MAIQCGLHKGVVFQLKDGVFIKLLEKGLQNRRSKDWLMGEEMSGWGCMRWT